MRNIVILLLIIVALAIVRSLVSDVSRAVGKAMKPDKPKESKEPKETPKTGRFVRDPQTGAFVDEASALHAEVDGESYYFESAKSRDAYLRGRPKG
jgi:hypothetical protein